MRKLFIISTIIFWLVVAGFWLASFLYQPTKIAVVPSVAQAAIRAYSLEEIARHNQQNDCWMTIEGQAYDITTYLPNHPSSPKIILAWCGKEATQAWQTKTRGRPHSPRAQELLSQYHIGKLHRMP